MKKDREEHLCLFIFILKFQSFSHHASGINHRCSNGTEHEESVLSRSRIGTRASELLSLLNDLARFDVDSVECAVNRAQAASVVDDDEVSDRGVSSCIQDHTVIPRIYVYVTCLIGNKFGSVGGEIPSIDLKLISVTVCDFKSFALRIEKISSEMMEYSNRGAIRKRRIHIVLKTFKIEKSYGNVPV